ncbi:TetR/AcrR family transcriptional regulator [Ruminococcus sp.]|uniref:TetR/AcrR family transcriptional regulator n=1 Tax=Ruminococcus sp. TaxID=41978 RepID=UPI0025FCC65F|nr:TetR/AcrR family transcriptional regulator [Ruminococcus sp.]MBQ8966112.1 TetR/AcrR family transcriptional regulator [Ruminococcus sp.]
MKGEKGERRRKELLGIAYRMFSEKGYENTSIDDIIAEAGIAKGTYYYHFPSKEATLEAVIDMMLKEEAERAQAAADSELPVPQKMVAVICALRPEQSEQPIADALESNENALLHHKLKKRLLDVVVPPLAQVVREGVAQGIFNCGQVEERVKMILGISMQMFDDYNYTENDVIVFIDMVEKAFGAEEGTMGFVRELIR